MKPEVKGQGRRFVLLRVKTNGALKPLRYYLTQARTWSRARRLARTGTYAVMKSLLIKMKGDFPDIILEECPK